MAQSCPFILQEYCREQNPPRNKRWLRDRDEVGTLDSNYVDCHSSDVFRIDWESGEHRIL